MDRGTRNLLAVLLVAVIAVTGGAALILGGAGGAGSGASPRAYEDGVVVRVEATGLDEVQGFTVRTADGRTVRFRLGVLENGVEFPPGHLVEHQATAQPVRVFYVTEDGEPVAIRLEDAP